MAARQKSGTTRPRADRAPAAPSRPSPSADAALAEEIARIRAMTPLERMELALALGRRRQELLALRAAAVPKP